MFKARQVSSLEKVFYQDIDSLKEVNKKTLMRGETFSYQIAMQADVNATTLINIDSPLKDYIKIYAVENAAMFFFTAPEYTSLSPLV